MVQQSKPHTPFLVSELLLPRTVKSALYRNGIFSVKQLSSVKEKELRTYKGMDKKGIRLIRMRMRSLGLQPTQPIATEKSRSERLEEILSMYQSGKTLQFIGDRFRLTRERVRQIIVAAHDASSFEEMKKEHELNRPNDRQDLVTYLKGKAEGSSSMVLFCKELGLPWLQTKKFLPELEQYFKAKRVSLPKSKA